MKSVTSALSNYIRTHRHYQCFDLYELHVLIQDQEYILSITDAPFSITLDGTTYKPGGSSADVSQLSTTTVFSSDQDSYSPDRVTNNTWLPSDTEPHLDKSVTPLILDPNAIIIERDRTSITSGLSVDTLDVKLRVIPTDHVLGSSAVTYWMDLAQNGGLDDTQFSLKRVYLDPDTSEYLGHISLFKGYVSVTEVTALSISLSIQSRATGLSYSFPSRRFIVDGNYTSNNGVVSKVVSNDTSVMIPSKPTSTVLY